MGERQGEGRFLGEKWGRDGAEIEKEGIKARFFKIYACLCRK